MEHTDWLHAGYDPSQARFLMLTAITRHNFRSPAWGEAEVRRLYAELTAIDAAAADAAAPDAVPITPSFQDSRFPATRPADGRPASRMRRLLRWFRLESGRNQDVRWDTPSANRTDWPGAWGL